MSQSGKGAWSAAEDTALLNAIEKGSAIGEIAEELGRTMDDCRARLAEITAAADGVFPRETAAS